MHLPGELRTSDIRVILNSTTGATAATSFILLTNLLDQFRLVAREVQANSARDDDDTESHGCSAPLGGPTIANTEDEPSEDEISTSDTSSGA